LAYTQDIDSPKTEYMMDMWQHNKEYFYRKFGQKLIYEFPEKVSFELSEEEQKKSLRYFITDLQMSYNPSEINELSLFLEEQEKGFFKNTVVNDYTTPEGKVIRKGAKIVKSFKHFLDNKKMLTNIQNKASMIIQESKIEGRLCLSIHPLDYLTISENNYNWRSCHSLDGDYRAGNLSYMMDEATFVCYLRSDEDVKLTCLPNDMKWNSKKWRVLFYLSNDNYMMFAGKQYPFETATGMNFVFNQLLPKVGLISTKDKDNTDFTSTYWTGWCKPIASNFNMTNEAGEMLGTYYAKNLIPMGDGKLITINELFPMVKGAKQFNDVTSSSCYTPLYAFCQYDKLFRYKEDEIVPVSRYAYTRFTVGHMTKCLRCGSNEIIMGGGTMHCHDCEIEYGDVDNEDYGYCSCCERHIYLDDAYYVEGEYICEHCLTTEASRCECCDDYFFNENIRYYEEYEEWLCDDCYSYRKYSEQLQ
jgi:hypothetical protein